MSRYCTAYSRLMVINLLTLTADCLWDPFDHLHVCLYYWVIGPWTATSCYCVPR